MKWFKHDSDAHRDAKLKKVIIKYGMSGYGLYWYCLEEISHGVSENKFTFELESDADVIAHDTGINTELVSEMMTFMVNLGLFENQSGVISCLKMLNRLDLSMTSNAHMRNIISRAKSGNSHDKVMTESCSEKSRVDKSIKDINTSSPKVNNAIPYQEIVDLYHQILPTLPRVEKLTATRKSYIRQRYVQDLKEIGHWENFFDHVKQSKFLMGMTTSNNGRKPFKANLEWLTKESNYVKISEETYHG